jgi:hypothetical protein
VLQAIIGGSIMKNQPTSATRILVIVVIGIVLLVANAMLPVRAGSPDDGRINQLPWANSFGAIAVYCVDQFDRPASSYAGGGIKILGSTGQKLFFASEAVINAASLRANQTGGSVVVHTESVYTLTVQPSSYFVLASKPDAEGKTVLGQWQNCAPVSSTGTQMPPVPACVPQFIRNEADSGVQCGYCYNGIDDDCNGKTDAQDFSCQYYCLCPR